MSETEQTHREQVVKSFWTDERIDAAFSHYEPFLDDYLEKRWDDTPLSSDLEPAEMDLASKVSATLNIANDDYSSYMVFDKNDTYQDPFELLSYLVTLGEDEDVRVLDASEEWVLDIEGNRLQVDAGTYYHGNSHKHFAVNVEEADFYFAGPHYSAYQGLQNFKPQNF